MCTCVRKVVSVRGTIESRVPRDCLDRGGETEGGENDEAGLCDLKSIRRNMGSKRRYEKSNSLEMKVRILADLIDWERNERKMTVKTTDVDISVWKYVARTRTKSQVSRQIRVVIRNSVR